MELPTLHPQDQVTSTTPRRHHRTPSGSILSKLSIQQTTNSSSSSPESGSDSQHAPPVSPVSPTKKAARSLAVAVQQQRTRRRRGSLRKAALLGRGAQRDKTESERESTPLSLPLDITSDIVDSVPDRGDGGSTSPTPLSPQSPEEVSRLDALGISLGEGFPSLDASASTTIRGPTLQLDGLAVPSSSPPSMPLGSPRLVYTSTTDDEDGLVMSSGPRLPTLRNDAPNSSGPDGYFPMVLQPTPSLARRRSPGTAGQTHSKPRATSPLSLSTHSASSSPHPNINPDWDYTSTSRWGWIILCVTWLVFVVGMGSCLDIWSWAWDVGETPYAPPELEDDPTLPIVGYYPALIILTGIMAWVWVVVAWVGMKYFRHAKISGD